jgi:hypothetical protein
VERKPSPKPEPAAPARSEASGDASPVAGDPEVILAGMLARCRPSIAQPLRSARVSQDDGTLVLEVPADLSAFAGLHADEYQQLAREAGGRPMKVRVAAAATPVEDTAEAGRRALVEEAMKEPAVRDAVDLFGGKVVQVRPGKQ